MVLMDHTEIKASIPISGSLIKIMKIHKSSWMGFSSFFPAQLKSIASLPLLASLEKNAGVAKWSTAADSSTNSCALNEAHML